ncbi:MAG TPA: hypothetical protein VFZ15_03135, partial [Acidimicrobiia bacterium]|nr:hypothetical protein [Acidimicrobiia bacterium]
NGETGDPLLGHQVWDSGPVFLDQRRRRTRWRVCLRTRGREAGDGEHQDRSDGTDRRSTNSVGDIRSSTHVLFIVGLDS